MKLQDIVKQILKEDTWGNNPSAAGSMSPGRSPTAKSPSKGTNFINLKPEMDSLVSHAEAAEEKEKERIEKLVKQQLVGKNVTVKASKGSVGQTEQDYTIDVVDANINDLNDVFYTVLKGAERSNAKESDYYVNTNFQVKINGQSNPEDKESLTSPSAQPQPIGQSKLKQAGGVVPQQPLNIPQR